MNGLLTSKLRPAQPYRWEVPRERLLQRLREGDDDDVVLVSAPSGYGKSTLLAQWARSSGRDFAWLTLDRHDNDPVTLMTYLAAAVAEMAPLAPRILDQLSDSESPVIGTLLPRLLGALDDAGPRGVLVIDELQELTDTDCLEVVDSVVRHRPPGLRLVLCGQGRPVTTASFRTRATALEIDSDALRMSESEAEQLFANSSTETSADRTADLVASTEGWAAGLYVTALAGQDGDARRATAGVRGDAEIIRDLVRSEVLDRLPEKEVDFLVRTSVLERISAPLCDAVLGEHGSAEMLIKLNRSQLFLTELDDSGDWYRYHRLFREALRWELDQRHPGLADSLLAGAADWSAEHDAPEVAVSYAAEAGDIERVSALVFAHAQSEYQRGRAATVERWFDWLDANGGMEAIPGLAASAAWFSALRGSADRAEHWMALAAQRLSPAGEGSTSESETVESCLLSLLRAMRCERGAAEMLEASRSAFDALPASNPWRTTMTLMLGMALTVNGEDAEADELFDRAIESGTVRGGWNAVSLALAERAAIAIRAEEWDAAKDLADRAVATVVRSRMQGYPPNALVYAVAARVAIHRSELEAAEQLLANAQTLRPRLTHVLAAFSLQLRVELAGAYVALADPAGARTILREIDVLRRYGRDFGALEERIEGIRTTLDSVRDVAPGSSTLTAAELRILPLLATQRTFPEIGEQLHLSRYTIKSHATSIYRKLEVSSRTEAVEQARKLGLL